MPFVNMQSFLDVVFIFSSVGIDCDCSSQWQSFRSAYKSSLDFDGPKFF